jgi:hypothetical protein
MPMPMPQAMMPPAYPPAQHVAPHPAPLPAWNQPAPQWGPPPMGQPVPQSARPYSAAPPPSGNSTWAWLTAGGVVIVAGVVAVVLLLNGGSPTRPTPAGTAVSATGTAAGEAGKPAPGAFRAALPSPLRDGSTCKPAADQSDVNRTRMSCTIPADSPLLTGLSKYADIDQDFEAWIDPDPAKVVSDWRRVYAPKIAEDDAKFVVIDDSYDPTFVALYYENTTNGLHVEFDGFSSTGNTRAFLTRAGL